MKASSFIEVPMCKSTFIMAKLNPLDIVNICILTTCLIFVAYMTTICFENYLKHPQGAKIIMKKIQDEITPQFTVCPLEFLNKTFLEMCSLDW